MKEYIENMSQDNRFVVGGWHRCYSTTRVPEGLSCQGQGCSTGCVKPAVPLSPSASFHILMITCYIIKQDSCVESRLEACSYIKPIEAPWWLKICRHSGCIGLYWISGEKKTSGRKLNQKYKRSANKKENVC